jgi:hypothetical protein
LAKLEGASPDAPKNFSAVQEHCPPENYSSFAAVLARQESRHPNFSPTKVGAQVFRHQLRVKTRSVNGFGCVIKYGLKSTA